MGTTARTHRTPNRRTPNRRTPTRRTPTARTPIGRTPTARTPIGRFAATSFAALVMAGSLAAACTDDGDTGGGGTDEDTSTTEAALAGDDLALNEIQMLGSHNSYHLPATPEVADAIEGLVPSLWQTISYEHQPLTAQLDEYGIRQFELDVFADPEGGLYTNPAAHQLLGLPPLDDPAMAEPGFKVAHIADVDFNTTCATLVACLTEIEEWSSAHPDHLPIMVMVETKGDDLTSGAGDLGIDLASLGAEFATPPEMTPELFDELEAEVLSVFPEEQIITPDDVRGDSDSLEDAVLEEAWPTIGESRGKVMFSLVDTGAARDTYTADAPNLEGKLFFTSSEEGRPDAAFIRVDDSLDEGPRLKELAEKGYLIRTRTDEPGVHAPANDRSLADSAIASGGHYLSTDYYSADPTTGFVVELPGGGVARCNPVSASEDCRDEWFAEG